MKRDPKDVINDMRNTTSKLQHFLVSFSETEGMDDDQLVEYDELVTKLGKLSTDYGDSVFERSPITFPEDRQEEDEGELAKVIAEMREAGLVDEAEQVLAAGKMCRTNLAGDGPRHPGRGLPNKIKKLLKSGDTPGFDINKQQWYILDRSNKLKQWVEAATNETVLRKWWDKVKNQKDWKAPIDWTGKLTPEEIGLVSDAIMYHTATEPEFIKLPSGSYRVIADGYRMGPAGDH